MTPRPLCSDCKDAARTSLANEIRGVLKTRGHWAPATESDLISATAQAIESARRDGFNEGLESAAKLAETSKFYDGETVRKIRALKVTT